MCTVTFLPKGENGFVLTSNRDEAPGRTSLIPDFYTTEGAKLLFPKDEMSGGTWIGISEKSRVVCVLNGGFVPHKRQSNYRLSRGIVAKDFMVSDAIETTIHDYNFFGIEPFTMVIADWNASLRLLELVWDGHQKHLKELTLQPRIWSSSTLYSESMKQERNQWFESFKDRNELNASSLLEFHETAGAGNEDYGVIMDRGFVKTTSITQVVKQEGEGIMEMHYEDLQHKKTSQTVFNLTETVNE